MRVLLVVFALLLALPLPAAATSLSTRAAAMATGTWVEFTEAEAAGTNWNNGAALAHPSPLCNGESLLSFLGKAVWNPVANRFALAGGIHTCSPGAGPHDGSIYYDEASNTWGYEPIPYANMSENLTHGWDTNAMDTAGGHYYSTHNSPTVARLPNGGSSWQLFTFPQQSSQSGNANIWFPDYQGGRLIHFDMNWGVWSLNPATGATACLANTLTGANACFPATGQPTTDLGGASTGVFAQYLSICQCVLFGGGGNLWRMSSSGVFTAMSTTNGPPSLYTAVPTAAANVYFVDPVSGRLLALGNGFTSGNLWEFDPLNGTTGAWRSAAPSSSIPAFIRNALTVSEVSCTATPRGVAMCVATATPDVAAGSRVFLYKHGAAQAGPGPSAPLNVSTH